MGICGSSGDSGGNSGGGQISTTSLLLLGAPGVGKSTVFKQMQVLYMSGFSDETRLDMAGNIVENVLQASQTVARAAAELEIELSDVTITTLDELEEPLVQLKVRNAGEPPVQLKPELWNELKQMWQDSGMKQAFDVLLSPDPPDGLKEFKVEPSTVYFLENFDRISQPDFKPNDNDMLRLRRVTEEAVTINFNVDMEYPPGSGQMKKMKVECTDVGGQAHHEYDWRKYSEITNAVLYVAALSEFCVVKPDGTNTLQHQFDLLAKVYASAAFENKEIIILLNKSDLLEIRLKKTQLRKYFPAYRGDNSEDDVIKFFTKKVESMLQDAAAKSDSERLPPRTVKSNALDTKFVESILLEFFISIITRNMVDCGFMSMDD